MKNKNLCIALAAIIGFAMVACVSPDDPGGGETPDFIAVTDIAGLPSHKQVDTDLTLSGTVLPTEATNKNITWSIADAGNTGATVTGSVLKTTAVGTATVTATVINGASETTDYTKNFTISVTNVIPFIPVSNIIGVPTTTTAGTDLALIGLVEPSDATNKTIAWSIATTNNLNGATVVNGVLKTTAAGTATVTATVVNGATTTTDYTKNFTITVTDPPITFIPVTNITDVLTTVTAGTDVPNLPLGGTVVPSNATNKTIVWSIADAGTTGATIVNNGTLKVTAAGTAIVTATIINGKTATTNYTKDFTITVTAVSNPGTFNDITASQLVANIKVGWNLGNSLDAYTGFGANPTVTQMEMGWGNPVTTKAMITALKNAGFNGIRIPVSWTKAAGGAPNYTIRTDWMNRVVEVVNYAADNEMYIILNTHHDEDVFKFMDSNAAAGKAAFQKIWEQIADTFKNYNEKLIFEGLNEPRTIGSSAEWGGGTDEERANINAYYQTFVNTVRASGGNNAKRILQINTYAASAEQSALSGLTLPTDTVQNKLIVSVHIYAPYNFAMNKDGTDSWSSSSSSDISGITVPIDRAYNTFAKNGTPVIIGEFGARNKNNNTSARAAWAEYYVSYAKGRGIPCFLWDNGVDVNDPNSESFEIFNRSSSTFSFPTIKDALIRGANNPINPGDGDPTPPNNTGNMGNYSFGTQENSNDPNYQQAVWTLTGTALAIAKQSGAKLVLELNAAPTGDMQLVWQGLANEIWWEQKDILNNGNPISGTGVTWNVGTKTLTINLATALKNYSSFTAQPSLNLIICYYGTANITDLGITSANLTN
jgi:endoglucanase